MGSEVKGESVENSVIKINEIADSTLEEATRLREGLKSILNPSTAKEAGTDKKQEHGVKVIADLETAYDALLDARYIIRDIMDRLAL